MTEDLWGWPDPKDRSRRKVGTVDEMLSDYGLPPAPVGAGLAPTLNTDEAGPGDAPTLAG